MLHRYIPVIILVFFVVSCGNSVELSINIPRGETFIYSNTEHTVDIALHYGNADRIVLFVNGGPIHQVNVTQNIALRSYRVIWNPLTPGLYTLSATAYRGEAIVGESPKIKVHVLSLQRKVTESSRQTIAPSPTATYPEPTHTPSPIPTSMIPTPTPIPSPHPMGIFMDAE